MLDWKFPQVCDEYYDVLYGMCYDVTHDADASRIAAFDCLMEVAEYMKPTHDYEDAVLIAILAGINFVIRKWHENHLDELSPPVIEVDKR